MPMQVDMRIHQTVRNQVHAGISALRVQARQIWGETQQTLPEIAVRLMVGVGDIARAARDGRPKPVRSVLALDAEPGAIAGEDWGPLLDWERELKKELGNILFSTIRWIDDLGLDPLECLDLAINAQEKFAKSGRPR